MKNSILTLTTAHVYDSKQYINGNVAEHLINEIRNLEFGYYSYLTEEEIDLFEKDDKKRDGLIEEVENFINNNFNFENE